MEKIEKELNNKIAVISSHTHSLFWFRIDMMNEFIVKGYDVIAVGQESEDLWREKFNEYGIKYRQIYVERNGINPLKDLKTLKQLNVLLKEEKPNKIFCYQAKSIIYTCLAAKKYQITEVYPLIAGLGSVFRGDTLKSKVLKSIMAYEYKAALRNSKIVMFQNNDDLSLFIKHKIVSESKCRIINGSGVDVKKFQIMDLPEHPTFLLIARLIKDKGVMEYLNACRSIKQKYSEAQCLLVGPYDTNPSALKPHELESYIKDGSIIYFGEQDDVRPFIQQSSVFVLPSYHEGTPKTVLENMACGRAIITTDAPGCRETVIEGLNGFLVPIQNVDALIEKMILFIEKPHLAKKMGEEGRKMVELKYDVRIVNSSIMDIMSI